MPIDQKITALGSVANPIDGALLFVLAGAGVNYKGTFENLVTQILERGNNSTAANALVLNRSGNLFQIDGSASLYQITAFGNDVLTLNGDGSILLQNGVTGSGFSLAADDSFSIENSDSALSTTGGTSIWENVTSQSQLKFNSDGSVELRANSAGSGGSIVWDGVGDCTITGNGGAGNVTIATGDLTLNLANNALHINGSNGSNDSLANCVAAGCIVVNGIITDP